MIAAQFEFGPDLPSLDGHFPGNPIVPGVVLLERAISAIASGLGGAQPVEVKWAKFRAAVRPPATITLAAHLEPHGIVNFELRQGERVVLDGVVRVALRGRPDARP
ncbi:MAG TPA: 3-hydroxyacyl-ACP dehydratase [Alphaproteobacteria bacterium]|nr:3-hydroxyacyl-ACP dehydratase [Alphaproteobacteria bacterium]